MRDFAPITRIVVAANMLVVHPSMPVRSVKELAAFAKARPDQLNYGSSGTGTPEALAAQIKRELVLYASIIKKSGMKVY